MPDVIYPWRLVKLAEFYRVAKKQAGKDDKFGWLFNEEKPEAKIDHGCP